MLSEALDITIESRGSEIRMILSGPFRKEQVPSLQSKLEDFIRDGHHDIVVDLEHVTSVHESVAPMFLSLLNSIRGKGGVIRLVFRSDAVSSAFAPYRNIFTIYPDIQSMSAGSLVASLKLRGQILGRKTGIRLSRPVAMFIMFLLFGWFASMVLIIRMQHDRIMAQDTEIRQLTQSKISTDRELSDMHERLKPMMQLGLLCGDTSGK